MCLHKIKSPQPTAHIFARHHKIKTSQVFKHLLDWVPRHLDWIKSVGKKILTAKGIRVEDYANDITSGLVPLGILVVCIMYHIHVGVVLKDHMWYTSSAEKPDDCLFYLLFPGSVHSLDSCTGNWGYSSPPHSVTVDITESSQAEPMSLVTDHKENENPAKNPLPMHPLKLLTSTIGQKLDELNLDLDLKSNKENRKRNLDQSIDSTSSSTSSRKHRRSSSSMVLHSKNTSVNYRKKPKKAPPEHHREQKAINLILIWIAFFQRTIDVEQNQKNLKDKDPILDASKDVQNEEDLKTLLEPSDDEQNKKSIAVEETIDTGDGAMLVKSYRLKQNNRKERKFACQEHNCLEVKKTQEEFQ